MKKRIIAPLLFLLFFITGFSQNLNYEVRGKYEHPIKKEKLNKANFMADIIPYYPAAWIMSYVSTEVSATYDGKVMIATSTNDTLSIEQKNILNTVDLGTDIIININYKYKNSVTDDIVISTIHYSATIVPEIEAEYPKTEAQYSSGYQQMTQYLKENAINKIPGATSKQFQGAIVSFTVNEEGEIVNAQISKTSGDRKTDRLLLKAIKKMPKWRAAENSNGIKVKQEFEFSVFKGGC